MLLLTAFHTGISDDSYVHMPGTPDLLFIEWLGWLQCSAVEC